VANTGSGFVISSGGKSAPAAFIFATLDGHIEAWNPKVDPATGDAQDEATVPGAGYTGLAIASTSAGDELFAANYATGPINGFNSSFQQVTLAPWQFTGTRLPAGYRAFNTQVLDGRVFVTYDTLNPSPRRAPDRKASASASAWWTSSAPMADRSRASLPEARSTLPGDTWPTRSWSATSVTAGSASSRRGVITLRIALAARSWTHPPASCLRSRGSAPPHGVNRRYRRALVRRGHCYCWP